MRLLERGRCFREFRRRVLFSAGRARGVDGALRSIDFFLRWLGAAGGEEEKTQKGSNAAHRAGSIAGMVYR